MKTLTLLILLVVSLTCSGQETIPLYPNGVPNALPATSEGTPDNTPTLSVFLPPKDKANGTAIIICPGGGYGTLVMKREGSDVAQSFNEMGIAAFVLKYRLPSPKTMKDQSIGPLQDAQQAIRMVRQRSKDWGIRPDRIGIIGFSAGGHLASTVGTHFTKAYIENPEGTSLRPDFMILIYPVISFTDSLKHSGSRTNLLGNSPSPDRVRLFSNELQVTAQTPPALLLHAGDDLKVPVGNSIRFYEALQRHGVAASMHIYAKGDHGFPLSPAKEEWMDMCRRWLRSSGWVK